MIRQEIKMPFKVLSLSDVLVEFIYSPRISARFSEVDFVVSCGDLPHYYLEYVVTTLNIPLYYVRGNHSNVIEYTSVGTRTEPHGAVDVHRKVISHQGLLLAGVEGCLRYRDGPYLYSQADMWRYIFGLIPGLLRNQIVYGRYLDIFVSHAPPWGIHDQPDLPHQGIKAFRWFLEVFRPAYHFHGHVHVYRPDTVIHTRFLDTQVINTYGYLETSLDPGVLKRGRTV